MDSYGIDRDEEGRGEPYFKWYAVLPGEPTTSVPQAWDFKGTGSHTTIEH